MEKIDALWMGVLKNNVEIARHGWDGNQLCWLNEQSGKTNTDCPTISGTNMFNDSWIFETVYEVSIVENTAGKNSFKSVEDKYSKPTLLLFICFKIISTDVERRRCTKEG